MIWGRVKGLERDVAYLKAEHERLFEKYWELVRDKHALLSHLGLRITDRPTMKIVEKTHETK